MADPPTLYLASRSPRRRALLEQAGVRFEAVPADIDETPASGARPADHAERLAAAKASAVASPGAGLVLGADTIVVHRGAILEKPAEAAEARARLERLSADEHEVITGLALDGDHGRAATHCVSRVRFRRLAVEEIEASIAAGTPFDKAGGYGIQDEGLAPVERVTGCAANVMGLPLCTLDALARELGVALGLRCPGCAPDASGAILR